MDRWGIMGPPFFLFSYFIEGNRSFQGNCMGSMGVSCYRFPVRGIASLRYAWALLCLPAFFPWIAPFTRFAGASPVGGRGTKVPGKFTVESAVRPLSLLRGSSPGMILPFSSFSTCTIVQPPRTSGPARGAFSLSMEVIHPRLVWQLVSYVPCSD